mgnify:CR=1 FL=1
MKKTNATLNAAIAVLFVGVMLYLGVYVFRSVNSGYVTAEAVYVDLNVSTQTTGLIVREEAWLQSDQAFVDVIAADGKNVAAGEVVANGMESQNSMESTARIHELEMQISRAEAAADSSLTADEDADIRSALFSLSAAVARGEISRVYEPEVVISSRLFRGSSLAVDSSELSRMKAELEQLRRQTKASSETITAPVAGIFTTAVDGYEHLMPDDLDGLTPETLRELASQRRDREGCFGKIVTGTKWYYAALVNAEDAERLEQGKTATLDLGKYASGMVTAVVERVSHPQNGQCAVVFKCRTALNDTLALRELTAEIVYEEVSGLRVPSKAVHVDEEGQTFVYVISAMQVERKDVEVLYTAGDYYIMAVGTESDSLRAGNEIIVSGRGMEDGTLLA